VHNKNFSNNLTTHKNKQSKNKNSRSESGDSKDDSKEDGEIIVKKSASSISNNSTKNNNYTNKDNKVRNDKHSTHDNHNNHNNHNNKNDLTEDDKKIEGLLEKFKLSCKIMKKEKQDYLDNIPTLTNLKIVKCTEKDSSILLSLSMIALPSLTILNDPKIRKINLILDLDSTMVFAENNEMDKFRIHSQLFNPKQKEMFNIEFLLEDKFWKMNIRIRKNVINLLRSVSKFCNIFINTHGQTPYAIEVIKLLSEKSKVHLSEKNLYALKSQQARPPAKKISDNFNAMIGDVNNYNNYEMLQVFTRSTVILDDNPQAWVKENHPYIVPSMKYFAFNPMPKPDKYVLDNNTKFFYILNRDNQTSLNDELNSKVLDEFGVPYSIETEYSTSCQVNHLKDLFENIFKYMNRYPNIDACDVITKLRGNILLGVLINIDYIPDEMKPSLTNLILTMGGKIQGGTENKFNVTHFVINGEINKSEFKKAVAKNHIQLNRKLVVNVKWIIHCYFHFKTMNENDSEYTMA